MARAAADNALVTFAVAQELLDYPDSAADKAQFFINAVSDSFESYCGRIFKSQSVVELHDGNGDRRIVLRQYPVTAVTELVIDTNREFLSADALDSDEYGVNENGVITLYDTLAPYGPDVIKVTYTAGYATVPEDLQQACLEAVEWNMARFSGSGIGIDNQSGAGLTVKQEMELPLSVIQKLSKYRKGYVAGL